MLKAGVAVWSLPSAQVLTKARNFHRRGSMCKGAVQCHHIFQYSLEPEFLGDKLEPPKANTFHSFYLVTNLENG